MQGDSQGEGIAGVRKLYSHVHKTSIYTKYICKRHDSRGKLFTNMVTNESS